MILRLQDSLELTEDQVGRLETLREAVWTTMRPPMMQGMQGMHAASELLASDSSDLDAYATRLREAASHMVQAHVAMARAGVEARQVPFSPTWIPVRSDRESCVLIRVIRKNGEAGGHDGRPRSPPPRRTRARLPLDRSRARGPGGSRLR